jgi:3-oxoacyl-[acyl-carrier protein] reductase
MGLLDNKTAIVTGSSRGIGAEVAKFLAAEGAAVVVNYRQKAPRANKVVAEIEAAGGRLSPARRWRTSGPWTCWS